MEKLSSKQQYRTMSLSLFLMSRLLDFVMARLWYHLGRCGTEPFSSWSDVPVFLLHFFHFLSQVMATAAPRT